MREGERESRNKNKNKNSLITSAIKGEGGYAFTHLCLFVGLSVCLSVCRISQKVVDGFGRIWWTGWVCGKDRLGVWTGFVCEDPNLDLYTRII